MKRYASAYWRPGKILIYPLAKTEPGFLVDIGPWLSLPTDAPSSAIGEAVLAVIGTASGILPQPDWRSPQWRANTLVRHRAAGVGSERQYMAASKLVQMTNNEETILLTPTHNGGTAGPQKGFHELKSGVITSRADVNADSLGAMVRETWARCT